MANLVQIVDHDRGYRKLLAEIRLRGAVVEVGVLGPNASGPKRVAEGQKAGKATLADVASYNEFGTKTIPARSFIGAWFDVNRAENIAFAKALALARMGGKLTYDQSLNLMGVRAQGGIQKRIAQGIPPANAASTIKRKGSSKPLVNTGQLRSSISFRIQRGVP